MWSDPFSGSDLPDPLDSGPPWSLNVTLDAHVKSNLAHGMRPEFHLVGGESWLLIQGQT